MSCESEQYMSLMNKVLDQEATKQEEEALFAHLAVCDECRVHFNELKTATELLRRLTHPHLPASFTKNVLDQLPPDKRHAIRRWGSRHPVLTTVALCAVPMSLVMIGTRRQWKEKSGYALVKMSGDQT
ncbi:zf-HC2 domain-containing protein [Sporolactobacillus sp. CPB3-1]|uniref:Anti-sigma-W factor RsiW n=1 Tax=Sporolactobacillus mangiferae TaxID=2940498 RepID=A0ABT0MB87_9BACL|nr:zf-HC2 domain-containing protein [Sporolactobacillus mangiferae]